MDRYIVLILLTAVISEAIRYYRSKAIAQGRHKIDTWKIQENVIAVYNGSDARRITLIRPYSLAGIIVSHNVFLDGIQLNQTVFKNNMKLTLVVDSNEHKVELKARGFGIDHSTSDIEEVFPKGNEDCQAELVPDFGGWYLEMIESLVDTGIPDRQECMDILKGYGTPEHVVQHCCEVTRVALALAEALNRHGFSLDVGLIQAAGLLHDVAKAKENHDIVGSTIVRDLGYDKVADIIQVHMKYSEFNKLKEINETDIVCIGNILVKGNEYVGIDARMDFIMQKSERNGNQEAEKSILEKKKMLKNLLNDIEQTVYMRIEELVKK